jgi:hypothetical protein
MNPNTAWANFYLTTTLTARLALGNGLSREDVAGSLESLAAAIRTQDCAEDMSAITGEVTPGEVSL